MVPAFAQLPCMNFALEEALDLSQLGGGLRRLGNMVERLRPK